MLRNAASQPEFCKSSEIKKYTKYIRSHAFEFFVRGVKHVLFAQHLSKDQTVNVTLNKAQYHKAGVSFAEAETVLPIILLDEVSGVKAYVDFDKEVKEFVFDIDGEPFENLLFLDSSFCLEDSDAKTWSAKITMNEDVIHDGAAEWNPYSLQHAIFDYLDENNVLIRAMKIEEITGTSSATLNQMLDLLCKQDKIPERGLERLTISGGDKQMSEPLDRSVMSSLV